jgi:hypothetical protein
MLGRHGAVERAVRSAQRRKPLREHPQRLVREPGSDMTAVEQSALTVGAGPVVPDQQRTDQPGPVALSWLPSCHHDLLPEQVLDLAPAARPDTCLIHRIESLDHHAFQSVGDRCGTDGVEILARECRRAQPAATVRDDGFEYFPAFTVGKLSQRAPVELEHVERQVGHRGHLGKPERLGRRGDVHPRLEGLEVRAAAGEGNDLAVQESLFAPDSVAERGHFGVGRGDVLPGPGHEAEPACLNERQGADPVPLELHRPGREVTGGRPARRREHGRQRGGQRKPLAVDHPVLAAGGEQDVAAD